MQNPFLKKCASLLLFILASNGGQVGKGRTMGEGKWVSCN